MTTRQRGVDKVLLYETDFVKWAEEQAALLTERRFELLDLENSDSTELRGSAQLRWSIAP